MSCFLRFPCQVISAILPHRRQTQTSTLKKLAIVLRTWIEHVQTENKKIIIIITPDAFQINSSDHWRASKNSMWKPTPPPFEGIIIITPLFEMSLVAEKIFCKENNTTPVVLFLSVIKVQDAGGCGNHRYAFWKGIFDVPVVVSVPAVWGQTGWNQRFIVWSNYLYCRHPE